MLDKLFNPQSIALIGASGSPEKVGHAILNNLVRFGFQGKKYPVNPQSREILGLRTFPRILDIDDEIDLAIIVIPAPYVPQVLLECAEMNVRFAVIVSAGFRESGTEGMNLWY